MSEMEYAVRDEYGDLMEWSCGCPRVFSTAKQAEIYAAFAHEEHFVVRRVATDWEPV